MMTDEAKSKYVSELSELSSAKELLAMIFVELREMNGRLNVLNLNVHDLKKEKPFPNDRRSQW